MRRLVFVLTFALTVGLLSTIVRGAPPTGSVTPGPNRTMTVCVEDPEDPPGTPETIELFVDHGSYPYDRFTLADGSCTTRGYAPFGPSADLSGGHLAGVRATDSSGQQAWLLLGAVLTESCSALGPGSINEEFCNAYPSYYHARQTTTWPLISDHVWAGISSAYGGAIQQLYSADRSFNLLLEHPGGAMQLSLWGLASSIPPQGEYCQGWVPLPDEEWKMNIIQTQGPHCSYGHPVMPALSGYSGPTVGALTNVEDPDNHLRHWTLNGFKWGQQTFIRPDHIEVNYRMINHSGYTFSFVGQEIPAIHLNQGMNNVFYWGRAGGDVGQATPLGTPWARMLWDPSARPQPPHSDVEIWNGSFLTACSAQWRCVTVAPHDQPTSAGVSMANMWSNWGATSTREGSNQMTMLGEFSILPGMDKSIRIYVFPYGWWESINGVTVRDRLSQLRGWL